MVAYTRYVRFGLATVLGLAPRGFFLPYRNAAAIAAQTPRPPYGAIEALFRGHAPRFCDRLAAAEALAGALRAIGDAPPPAPRWDQDWFPRLDAAMAYALVRALAPRRIVEIGAGHSTRFLARAVADGGLATRITVIDPAPRAPLAGLAVAHLRCPVQDAGAAAFAALRPGDVVFVDSSHLLVPGSDVDWLVNRILPTLPAGVYIHFHDIFLPDDYPADWTRRGYNEQLAIAPLLAAGALAPVFASHYVATRMADALAESAIAALPLPAGARESSLWVMTRSERS